MKQQHFDYHSLAYGDGKAADNELCWNEPPLLLLCYENSMDTVTPPLVPRLKFSFVSDAHHFLCKACFLLFAQIQNVPETHNDTQMQQKCNYRCYKLFVSELKYGTGSEHKTSHTQSKYSALQHCTLGDCTVTMATRPVTIKTLTWPTPRRAQRLALQSVSASGPTGARSFTASTERETNAQKWNVVSSYISSLLSRWLDGELILF